MARLATAGENQWVECVTGVLLTFRRIATSLVGHPIGIQIDQVLSNATTSLVTEENPTTSYLASWLR